MAKRRKNSKAKTRAEPTTATASFLCSTAAYDTLCATGYTKLSHNPEIMAAINKIATLVSSMTIYLMQNGENGDIRIRNGISEKIDINPNRYATRTSFISSVVRTLLLEGDGNSIVLPTTENGYISDLFPIPAASISFIPNGFAYKVMVKGQEFNPDDLLHFVINPDPNYFWKGTGYRTTLKEVAENLKQANVTKKGFMESKWKPSIIVKVDGMLEEFSDKEGRRKLLEKYVESSKAGEPWLLPADQFDVTEIRPLSLNDIAISDSVQMDKQTVAAILDVPLYVVGAGKYDANEWNNFINNRIRPICQAIEQEMTKKILIRPDWYFRFNLRSLYSYDIKTLSEVGQNMYTRGLMTGNEVRDWLTLSPLEGLDELVILENYIPKGMIGEQEKLKGGE